MSETQLPGDFSNRGVLVIGGAGGIGAALCRQLARRGAKLFIAGRDATKAAALATELSATSASVDAADFAQVDALFDRAAADLGPLAGVVNLAGSIMLKAAHQTSADDYAKVIAQNLTSAFAVVRAAGRVMRSAGGSVVLMSSTAARVGLPNHEAIAAAKAGIIGLAQAAAATYAPAIRVNVVAPGLTRTPMAQPLLSSELAEKASTAMHPLGRLGEPSDIASAILFLLDPANTWMTGQVISVDGGLSTVRPRVKV